MGAVFPGGQQGHCQSATFLRRSYQPTFSGGVAQRLFQKMAAHPLAWVKGAETRFPWSRGWLEGKSWRSDSGCGLRFEGPLEPNKSPHLASTVHMTSGLHTRY